jgi:hypothetical protein
MRWLRRETDTVSVELAVTRAGRSREIRIACFCGWSISTWVADQNAATSSAGTHLLFEVARHQCPPDGRPDYDKDWGQTEQHGP